MYQSKGVVFADFVEAIIPTFALSRKLKGRFKEAIEVSQKDKFKVDYITGKP